MRDFFFRVAALTFESSVLAELERGSARRIGDTVREYPRLPPPPGAPRCPPPTPFSLQTSQATRATCTSRRPARSPSAASEGAAPQRSPPVTPASPYQRAAAPAPPGEPSLGPGLGRGPRSPLSYANPLGGRRPQPSICLNKTWFFMLFKKGVGPGGGRQSQRQGAGGVVNFLITPKPKPGSECPKLGVQGAGPSIIPSPSGGGRSVAAGGGARSGRTCSAPGSSVRLRCPRCRRPPRLRDAQGAQHPLWPPRQHPGVPPPTCHDPPEPLHQPDGRSHGAPGFHPLVHQEDAQTWGGAEAASERPVPAPAAPPRRECPLGSPGETVSVRTSITFSRPE